MLACTSDQALVGLRGSLQARESHLPGLLLLLMGCGGHQQLAGSRSGVGWSCRPRLCRQFDPQQTGRISTAAKARLLWRLL